MKTNFILPRKTQKFSLKNETETWIWLCLIVQMKKTRKYCAFFSFIYRQKNTSKWWGFTGQGSGVTAVSWARSQWSASGVLWRGSSCAPPLWSRTRPPSPRGAPSGQQPTASRAARPSRWGCGAQRWAEGPPARNTHLVSAGHRRLRSTFVIASIYSHFLWQMERFNTAAQ